MTGDAIVAAARGWIGTPFRHQGSCRGSGADCLGLVLGVCRELGLPVSEPVPAYTPDWAEAGRAEVLLPALGREFRAVPEGAARPGDVVVFRMHRAAPAKHLGILSEVTAGQARFIHAYMRHGVVECALSAPWRARAAGWFSLIERGA